LRANRLLGGTMRYFSVEFPGFPKAVLDNIIAIHSAIPRRCLAPLAC
jgi:hypothetical protein